MVAILLANGFEEAEAIITYDLLRRAAIDVKFVSDNELVTSNKDVSVKTHLLYKDLNLRDIEMIILPGGMPGVLNLEKDENAINLIKYAYENDLYLSAICAAPSILGKMGILKGKNATCFPGFEKDLRGANFTDESTVKDGKIITSKALGTAFSFASYIIDTLQNNEISKKVKKDICLDD